jgi:hypothetical protein
MYPHATQSTALGASSEPQLGHRFAVASEGNSTIAHRILQITRLLALANIPILT